VLLSAEEQILRSAEPQISGPTYWPQSTKGVLKFLQVKNSDFSKRVNLAENFGPDKSAIYVGIDQDEKNRYTD
jgi:hypothetical protein